MIQAAMYFALGLLTAGLLVLLLAPVIWRRAVRLTRARIEASVPMTRAEIEADKDRLRADFAVSNRRLEVEERLMGLAHQRAVIIGIATQPAHLGAQIFCGP